MTIKILDYLTKRNKYNLGWHLWWRPERHFWPLWSLPLQRLTPDRLHRRYCLTIATILGTNRGSPSRGPTLPLNTLTAAVSNRYYNLSHRDSSSCRIPPQRDARFKVGPRISARFHFIVVKQHVAAQTVTSSYSRGLNVPHGCCLLTWLTVCHLWPFLCAFRRRWTSRVFGTNIIDNI